MKRTPAERAVLVDQVIVRVIKRVLDGSECERPIVAAMWAEELWVAEIRLKKSRKLKDE